MMAQMLELMIPFRTTMANAAERKETRYKERNNKLATQLISSLFK